MLGHLDSFYIKHQDNLAALGQLKSMSESNNRIRYTQMRVLIEALKQDSQEGIIDLNQAYKKIEHLNQIHSQIINCFSSIIQLCNCWFDHRDNSPDQAKAQYLKAWLEIHKDCKYDYQTLSQTSEHTLQDCLALYSQIGHLWREALSVKSNCSDIDDLMTEKDLDDYLEMEMG